MTIRRDQDFVDDLEDDIWIEDSPRQKSNGVAVVLICLGIGVFGFVAMTAVVGALVYVTVREQQRELNQALNEIDQNQQQAAATPAVRGADPVFVVTPQSEAVAKEIQLTFDEILAAARIKDAEKLRPLIAPDRLIDRCWPGLDSEQKAELTPVIRESMGVSLYNFQEGQLDGQICRCELSPDRRVARIVIRHSHGFHKNGSLSACWFCRVGGRWRIYDWEWTTSPGRKSLVLFHDKRYEPYLEGLGSPRSFDTDLVVQASNHLMESELVQAEELLDKVLKDAGTDQELLALHGSLLALLRLEQDQYEACLKACDGVDALGPDCWPGVGLTRAEALWKLNRNPEALPVITAHQEKYGVDSEVLKYKGMILEGLDRDQEALEAHRQALDLTPKSIPNLYRLGHLLPAEEKGELAQRFLRATWSAGEFRTLCFCFRRDGRNDCLSTIVDAYETTGKTEPIWKIYKSATQIWEDPQVAWELARDAASEVADNDPHIEDFRTILRLVAVRTQHAAEAYKEFGEDEPEIFRLFAEDVFTQTYGKIKERQLESLIAAAPTFQPDQPPERTLDLPQDRWPAFYEAWLLHARGQSALAVGLLERLLRDSTLDEATRTRFRRQLVESSVSAELVLRAYDSIEPRGAAFVELANALDARLPDSVAVAALNALIARRKEHLPQDWQIPFWEGRLQVRLRQFREALVSLSQAQESIRRALPQNSPNADEAALTVTEDDQRLVRELQWDVRITLGDSLQAYQDATDPKAAFQYFAAALAASHREDRHAQLRELIRLHRERCPSDAEADGIEGEELSRAGDMAAAAELFRKALASAIQSEDEDAQENWTRQLRYALVTTDQIAEAYALNPDPHESFTELFRILRWRVAPDSVDDRPLRELQRLYQERVPSSGEARVAAAVAQIGALLAANRKEYARAADLLEPLMVEQDKNPDTSGGNRQANSFRYDYLRNRAQAHQALEAYRQMADKSAAFGMLSGQYRYDLASAENRRDLRELLDEHRRTMPDDDVDWAELEISLAANEGRLDEAWALYTKFRDGKEIDDDDYPHGLMFENIKAGRVLDGWNRLAKTADNFSATASQIVRSSPRPVDDLSALVSAAGGVAGDLEVRIWQAEAESERKNPEGVVALLWEHRAQLAADEDATESEYWGVESLLFALVQTHRLDDAAELLKLQGDDASLPHKVVVAAARKDVLMTISLLKVLVEEDEDWTLYDLYRDEQLGVLLRDPELAEVREEFPIPVEDSP